MSLTSDSAEDRLAALRAINGTAHGAIFESQNVGYDENLVEIEAMLDDALAQPDALLALLADPLDEIRAEACELFDAFAQIGWGTAYIAGDEQNATLRALVVRALPALHAAIGDASADVRAAAIVAILMIPRTGDAARDPDDDEEAQPLADDPDELELVRGALHDADADVRSHAIRVLVRRRGRAAEADLAALVEDRERVVEDQLIEALGRYQSELVLPVIIRRVRLDPAGHTLTYTSDASETGTMLLDWLCAYPLDAQHARDILLPLASAGALAEFRLSDVVRGLVEHVDASCRDALAALVPAGTMASEYALIALARLHADAPLDAIAYWLDPAKQSERLDRLVDAAGIALVATGRTDHLDLLLQRLATGNPSLLGVLRIVSMFDDPRIFDAVSPLLRRGADVALTKYAALALGAAGNPAALPQLHEANATREARLYVQLAIALIDPSAVTAAPEQWPGHLPTNEVEHLILAYAVRLLGRRLAGPPIPESAKLLVDSARQWLASLDLTESLDCHRRRGGFSGIAFSWVFELRDVIAEAKQLLASTV